MAVAASFSGDWLTSLGNRRGVHATLTFSGTYTTGGESLTPAMLGLGAIDLGSVAINQGEDGLVFKYDYTNSKVLIYRTAAQSHTHDLLVIGGQAAAGTDTVQAASGDVIFGKEEAGNATIVGADSTTKGGVVAATLAAGALVELANGASLTGIVTQVSATGI